MLGVSAPPAIFFDLWIEYDEHAAIPSLAVIATIAYHILFPMVICYAAWSIFVARLPASIAAMGTLLVPIIGVASAAAILGDTLSRQKLSALAFVLLSIA